MVKVVSAFYQIDKRRLADEAKLANRKRGLGAKRKNMKKLAEEKTTRLDEDLARRLKVLADE